MSDNEISLEKELELLTMYIEFEQLQYQDTFDYTLTVPEELNPTNISLPPMLIQPYVENAIKHGISPKIDGGTIKIKISQQDEKVDISIEDDGVGFDNSDSKSNFKGIGLSNTILRIKKIYNQEISIESIKNQGTVVKFSIPVKK